MINQTDIFSVNYTALRLIIEHFNILEKNIGAEVGVLFGSTSAYLLKHFPSLTLLCIDPYEPYQEVPGERDLKELENAEKIAGYQLGAFGPRAKRLKATSAEVSSQMVDEGLDFVFIDALHTYEAVQQDLNSWVRKVRPGGLVAGHDYRWAGVKKAVDEYAERHNITGLVTGPDSDVWFFLRH